MIHPAVIGAISSGLQSSPPTLITTNLVLHYDFENTSCYPGTGTSISDLSASSYSATALNGVVFIGTTPKTFDFDGVDDKLELQASVPNLRPSAFAFNSSGFSISAWVKLDSGGAFRGIFCTDGANQTTYYGCNLFINSSSFFGMEINDGGGSGSGNRRTRISTFAPTLGNWYYVTANFDSLNAATWQIYVNGSTVTMNSPSGGASYIGYSSTARAAVGVRRNDEWNGKIAMVHVYNRKLTAAEILNNYNATKANFP